MKRLIHNFEDWEILSELVERRFKKKQKPFSVELTAMKKSNEQLGYLHSEVLPKLTVALYDAGEISKKTERHAKYWIKRLLNYGEWIAFDGGQVFDPSSFADASMEVLSDIIDTAIFQASARGVVINPPRGKDGAKSS